LVLPVGAELQQKTGPAAQRLCDIARTGQHPGELRAQICLLKKTFKSRALAVVCGIENGPPGLLRAIVERYGQNTVSVAPDMRI
jgi:hypothetical protein